MTSRADRLRARLADARLYLCIDARRHLDEEARGQGWSGDFPALRRDVSAALAGGVDIVQLRDKNSAGERDHGPLEAGHELRALAVMREVCDQHGAMLSVNDRADVAVASGADVLHVGQDDLPVEWARRIVGDDVVIGLSCHAAAEVDKAAANPLLDYFCAGPVWPTPTKPGRHAPGLDLVRHAAAATRDRAATPWFAIGGIDADTLPQVLAAGARRVVVVRAITGADDPEAAAAALTSALA
ncbi:thiamine phosphate synthase [Dietzia sp. ANT_WB102]|uniref:thiamine phosphate synthase n=1 Tax=Dietzia sp. ANT_WB102 TaxID=2597345 RepID=UPI0011F068F3|nr:thiamine phosphate synthase [Dietzia sp. ANT_WB102]KAA0918778.1 thiamine phosphate synthase [Dietzia sp. ANT_WB102]